MEHEDRKCRFQNRRGQSDLDKTPRRSKDRTSSSSEFGSPLNSLRSPLRPESTRASYSEGKRFHQERRYHQLRSRRGDTMPVRPKPEFANEKYSGDKRAGDYLQNNRNKMFSAEDVSESARPRTISGATDWGSIVDEEERNIAHDKSFRKRLELGQLQQQQGAQGAISLSKCNPEEKEEEEEEEVEHPCSTESDPKVLERRQKQIIYGIGTPEYENYCRQVPLRNRTKCHPWTPDKRLKYSRRGWDTVVRIWRKQLHIWDPCPRDEKLVDHLSVDENNLTPAGALLLAPRDKLYNIHGTSADVTRSDADEQDVCKFLALDNDHLNFMSINDESVEEPIVL